MHWVLSCVLILSISDFKHVVRPSCWKKYISDRCEKHFFKPTNLNFDATLHKILKSPYLIKFNSLRNINVFNKFHYNSSCGSLDLPVKAKNILHNSLYHLLWNDEDCIINFFSTVYFFYQFIQVGLKICTSIKGVHGVEAEQQKK